MKAERIVKMLEWMGASKIKVDENDVHSSCPLAPWLHEKGTDKRPSFGVSISDGISVYNCFSCHTKGNDVKNLVWKYEELSGKILPSELSEWLAEENFDVEKKLDPYDYYPEMRKEHTLPEEWWDSFAGSVPQYLLDRGITLDTARTWGLGYDKERKRLMFSIRNSKGALVSMAGRNIRSSDYMGKYWNISGVKKGRYLYGECKVLKSFDKIIVVEGYMDCLHVWQHGFHEVVASMGSALTKDQINTLVVWNKPVYLFFDGDLAGVQGMIRAIEDINGQIPVFVMGTWGKHEPTDYSAREIQDAINDSKLASVWRPDAEYLVKVFNHERKLKRRQKGV